MSDGFTRRHVLQAGVLAAASQGVQGGAWPRTPSVEFPKTQLPKRGVGALGLAASALGLGCMGMSEFYGQANSASVQRTLAIALEREITLFDTADMYGRGANEEMIGALLKGRRDRALIATKFGIVREGEGWRVDNRPAYVKTACEASLRRLGTDHIDLYYAHRINPQHPVEDMVGAMAELVREGKVRAIGVSEASAATIRRAHAVHPLAAVQTEYSLLSRDPERELIPVCRELGITFVPYSPLSRGLLTGAAASAATLGADDFRRQLPRFQPGNHERNQAIVARLDRIAARNDCTRAQLSLAWLLAQGAHIIPIPGTSRPEHLEENLGALSVALSADDMRELESVFPPGVAAGERYTDEEMKTVGL